MIVVVVAAAVAVALVMAEQVVVGAVGLVAVADFE